MCVSLCVGSEVECLFIRCYEEVEYGKDLLAPVQHCDGQLFPERGPSLVLLRRPVSRLYFAKRFSYWVRDCSFELRLHHHVRRVFAGWHNLKLLAIPPSQQQRHYIETPS